MNNCGNMCRKIQRQIHKQKLINIPIENERLMGLIVCVFLRPYKYRLLHIWFQNNRVNNYNILKRTQIEQQSSGETIFVPYYCTRSIRGNCSCIALATHRFVYSTIPLDRNRNCIVEH